MGFFLSDFLGNPGINTNTPVVPENNGYHGNNSTAEQLLSDLKAGQSFSAEIVGIKGNEVQLILGDNQTLTAKLEQNMNLALGQILHFEVKSNQGSQILLRPLLMNTSQDANLMKALDAANLPVNEKTVDMVKALMSEGMSIDKQSLRDMYKQIASHPQVSGETIVQMNRLQIPMTPENIGQFEAYKNFKHQLTGSLQTVVDELPKSFQEILQNTDEKGAFAAINRLLEIFVNGKEGNLTEENAIEENPKLPLENGEGIGKEQEIQKQSAENSNPKAMGNPIEEFPNKKELEAVLKELLKETEEGKTENKTVLPNQEMNEDGKKALLSVLEKADTPQEFLRQVQQMLKEGSLPLKQAKELFSAKEFLNILKSELQKQWFMEPQNVDNKSMEELYKRVQEQANRLLSEISNFAKEDSGLYKAVANIKENVDFMNQLNQMFTYVQLPLKMANQNAHGDLYVYTNKKSLAKKDGKVTALLHLDMEHLGPMDIYVSMQDQKVSTKFCLEKEEHLDFLEKHMHILTERLNKRGYQIQTEVTSHEKSANVMDEMLKQEKGNMVISQYAFDVRA